MSYYNDLIKSFDSIKNLEAKRHLDFGIQINFNIDEKYLNTVIKQVSKDSAFSTMKYSFKEIEFIPVQIFERKKIACKMGDDYSGFYESELYDLGKYPKEGLSFLNQDGNYLSHSEKKIKFLEEDYKNFKGYYKVKVRKTTNYVIVGVTRNRIESEKSNKYSLVTLIASDTGKESVEKMKGFYGYTFLCGIKSSDLNGYTFNKLDVYLDYGIQKIDYRNEAEKINNWMTEIKDERNNKFKDSLLNKNNSLISYGKDSDEKEEKEKYIFSKLNEYLDKGFIECNGSCYGDPYLINEKYKDNEEVKNFLIENLSFITL